MSTAVDLIGNTPLVEVRSVRSARGRVLAKAEFLNPGGSVKDRAALHALRAARARGELSNGQPVVEMTSGNMGSGLAVVCAVLGHPFIATMSAGNSIEREWMLQGLGARVVRTPQVTGAPGQVTGDDIHAATEQARHIARREGAYYVDQFNSIEGPHAHYVGTGAEILAQAPDLVGFAACVGTGATLCGTARRLKEARPATVCCAVEPAGAEVLAGKPLTKPRHAIQGAGYGIIPPRWDPDVVDRYEAVTDDDALEMVAQLGRCEGLYVGISSGANVVAATRMAAELGGTIVTILCDTGLKYPRRPAPQ